MSAAASNRTTVPILLFHRVVAQPDRNDRFAVTVDDFRAAIELVVASGRTPVTVSAYAERRRAGVSVADLALVTFDDGALDFCELALPVLEAFSIPATMYVVSGLVGGTATWLGTGVRLMDWTDLATLASASVEIELGAHSMSHPQLDLVGSSTAAEEIRRSKQVLEQGIGRDVASFAYPFGHHHGRVRAAVIDAGYTSAAAVKNRLSPIDDDLFAIARVTIGRDDGPGRVAQLLRGEGAPIARRRELVRTKAYRGYRRIRSSSRSGAR